MSASVPIPNTLTTASPGNVVGNYTIYHVPFFLTGAGMPIFTEPSKSVKDIGYNLNEIRCPRCAGRFTGNSNKWESRCGFSFITDDYINSDYNDLKEWLYDISKG